MKKAPKSADIEFSTDLLTYTKMVRGVAEWEEAVKSGKLTVKRAESSDVEVLKRIWKWIWEE